MNKKAISWINSFCLILFILDRIFKRIVFQGITKKFLIINFSLSLNKNIALGIPVPLLFFYFLLGIIIFFTTAMIIKSYQRESLINVLSLEIILVGAISNLLDRIFFGAVVDYLFIPYLTVFNLADLMILAGILSLFWRMVILNQPLFVKKR